MSPPWNAWKQKKKKKKKGKTQRRIQRKTLNPNGHIEFVSKNAKKDCVFTIDKRKSKISLANAYVTVPYGLRPFRAYLASYLKLKFSHFKQYYTYFYAFFHQHLFQKITNNIIQSSLPKSPYSLAEQLRQKMLDPQLHHWCLSRTLINSGAVIVSQKKKSTTLPQLAILNIITFLYNFLKSN